MVENLDFYEFACTYKVPGDSYISIRRRWVTARMVMNQYNCSSAFLDGGNEDLARVA